MPIVTVTMPCYNARGTLPRAIASLQAQTLEAWELVVVDDGSTDGSSEWVASVPDPRIRLLRHERNRGRGVARQTALGAVTAPYLAFLDADDWLYPDRLRSQVARLEADRRVDAISCGIASIDAENRLIGVRGTGSGEVAGPLDVPLNVPFIHAASMLRTEVARVGRYDADLAIGEDHDFLRSVLGGRRYVVQAEVYYAYAEELSYRLAKSVRAARDERIRWKRVSTGWPVASRVAQLRTFAKLGAAAALVALGQEARIVQRRNRPPTAAERAAHDAACAVVDRAEAALRARMGGSGGVNVTGGP